MRPHLSLDVRNVPASVEFYQKVFGVAPQKQTTDYAKFDLTAPALNFALVSSTGKVNAVNHLGIEVESVDDIAMWKQKLLERGILEKVEEGTECCFARQDKLWFTDPDGNAWEVFTVHEQLAVTGSLAQTGCCAPKGNGMSEPATCTVCARSSSVLNRTGEVLAWKPMRKKFGNKSIMASVRSLRSVSPTRLRSTTLYRTSGSRCSEGSMGLKVRAG